MRFSGKSARANSASGGGEIISVACACGPSATSGGTPPSAWPARRALLTAKDFSVEICYALEECNAARYAVTTTLRELRSAELARTGEFTAIFAGKFSEISFALKKGARVEAVVEALDGEGGLRVSYPSDCRECEITVEGVDARVRCTGPTLEIIFPRGAGPAELIEQFAAVRDAFRISKGLSGLIV